MAPFTKGLAKPRHTRASFVAVKTVTVRNEDDRDEEIVAGQTYVHDAGHFLVASYPHLFRRTDGRPMKGRPRQRRAAPARQRQPLQLPRRPLVRYDASRPSRVRVELREKAYLAITDQAFATRGEVETGGGLFGPAFSSDRVVVRFASDHGAVLTARQAGLRIDRGHVQRQAERYERDGVVGVWHTHPHPDDPGEPTDPEDLSWFANHMRDVAADHYIALILTPTWGQDRTTLSRATRTGSSPPSTHGTCITSAKTSTSAAEPRLSGRER